MFILVLATVSLSTWPQDPRLPESLPVVQMHRPSFALSADVVCPPGFDCSVVKPSGTPLRDSAERILADTKIGAVQGFDDVKKVKHERFLGPTNLLVGVGMGLAAWYDVKTTYDLRSMLGPDITRTKDGMLTSEQNFPQADGSVRRVTLVLHEKTTFYRSSVLDGNRGAMIRKKAYLNAPIWVISHFLRRSPHKIFKIGGWLLPSIAIGVQARAGVDNKHLHDEWARELH